MAVTGTTTVKPVRYINAEPGLIPYPDCNMPVVVLSYGGEEGPVTDQAVTIVEARQMVMDILESLASMGDPLAMDIGERYFKKIEASE